MFDGAIALRELTLGDDFSAVGSLNLPSAPNNYPYLGTWRNVGTAVTPPRHFSFTSAQLMNHYIGGAEGDTWVWEREACPDVERLPIRQVITTYTFD